jgi:hypothetical protein
MVDYKNIRTLSDIDRERETLRTRLSVKESHLSSSFMTVKEGFTPTALFAEGVRSVSSVIPLDRIVLAAVRFLKRRLSR